MKHRREILNQGFSILEVTMALGVITIGLLGVFSLVLQNLSVQRLNKNYMVASMLAQEGLELVRNIRDNNFLDTSGTLWNHKLTSGSNPYLFAIDYTNLNPVSVTGSSDPNTRLCLNVVGTTNFFSHNCGGASTPTIFRRFFTVTNNADNVEVKADVIWTEKGQTFNYEAVTYLYDWW